MTGVQRYALECSILMKELYKDEVIFLAPKGKINKDLSKKLNVKQVGIMRGHLWEQIELPIYSFFYSATLVCFCGMPPILKRNLVFAIHDIAFLKYPQFYNFFYRNLYSFFIKKGYKKAKKIFTVSSFTKKELIEFYGKREIYIVNNSTNHLKKEDSFSDLPKGLIDRGYILCVGSIEPRKNLNQLINVYLKETREYKMVIIGEKNKVFNQQDFPENFYNDDIVFTGYISDSKLASFYKYTKCFIYPSLYEGFGIPPLEAIFYGSPVGVSNIPAHREVLEDYAYFFNTNEPINLDKIINEANKLKNINILYNPHPLIKKYSQKNQKEQIISLLQNL